jgi:hypothetical protein
MDAHGGNEHEHARDRGRTSEPTERVSASKGDPEQGGQCGSNQRADALPSGEPGPILFQRFGEVVLVGGSELERHFLLIDAYRALL